MRRPSVWGAWLIAGMVAAITVSVTLAAPPLQNEPTITPTPTATGFGPTPTPTATLLPPPTGGGRVAVYVLVVRVSPGFDATPVGGLVYGEIVYPIGRSASGNWAAIEWRGSIRWILASLVQWDPRLDFQALPILQPPLTGTPPVASPSAAGSATPQASPSPRPSNTPHPTERPTSQTSDTPQPSRTPSPEPSATSVSAAVAPPTDPPQVSEPTPIVGTPGTNILLWIGLALPVVLLTVYGWRLASGQREVRRYEGSYPLDTCPVCQIGHLHLDETVHRVMGIARVNRTIRCGTCRSMLRQVRPGVWRYAIDPYVNPHLAADFNGRHFTDSQLGAFSVSAMSYEPDLPEPPQEQSHGLTDEEILAELEAKIPPDEPEPPAQVSDPGDSSAESAPPQSDPV